jgi:hypothetical protein
MMQTMRERGVKMRDLFAAVRYAVSASLVGVGVPDMLATLGKPATVVRLRRAVPLMAAAQSRPAATG